LIEVLKVGGQTGALEAVRTLIERIVVTPSPVGGSAGIEPIGEIRTIVVAAGINLSGAVRTKAAPDIRTVKAMLGSVNTGPGDHYNLVVEFEGDEIAFKGHRQHYPFAPYQYERIVL